MSVLEAAVSGIIQGLTEFLPVSSSGHLVIVHSIFGEGQSEIFFDICLHFATMTAVLIFFRQDIVRIFTPSGRMWRLCIAIGTVPAVIAGLFLEKHISAVFASPRVVALMLLVTSAVLMLAQRSLSENKRKVLDISPGKALIIGLAQAVAIVPGLSRSGLTISTGLFAGMNGERAFKFSFILSIPIIAGATLYKILSVVMSLGGRVSVDVPVFLVGMVFAFLSGLAGLFLLKKAVVFSKIWIFSVYCFFVGVLVLMIWR